MSKIQENYVFTAFGFDVLLHNVRMVESEGEIYPDINLNEVKLNTAKQLLKSKERLTGKKLKFLRTFLRTSYNSLGQIISAPPSTIRSWEEKGQEATGMSVPQERQMRIFTIESILNLERKHIEKQIVMAESYDSPSHQSVDLGDAPDLSYLNQAAVII